MGQSTFYKLSENKYDFILPKIIDVVKNDDKFNLVLKGDVWEIYPKVITPQLPFCGDIKITNLPKDGKSIELYIFAMENEDIGIIDHIIRKVIEENGLGFELLL